jgi:hypothetical protein
MAPSWVVRTTPCKGIPLIPTLEYRACAEYLHCALARANEKLEGKASLRDAVSQEIPLNLAKASIL